jgi:very-short-patch-repair endonuclease
VTPHSAEATPSACHERRLVIELDGSRRGRVALMAADARCTAFLNSSRYRVLRFWNNDVLRDIEAAMAAIHAVLSESAPHP